MLEDRPLSRRQQAVIVLCVALNAIDGFDILAISFAAPGIASEWHIDRSQLGLVLSMELIGMAVGSLVLGQVADRLGRRPAILSCLAIMSAGMFACSHADSVASLAALRFVTGLGIGGMLSAISALASESVNLRSRATAIALAAAGYPLGGVVGGAIATTMLGQGGWRAVFDVGALASGVLLALAWAMLPETPAFIMRQAPSVDGLRRLNRSLLALGQASVTEISAAPAENTAPFSRVFARGLRLPTIALVVSYFCHVTTFYFVLKWVPKIVADWGFSPTEAGQVMVAVSAGGLAGAIVTSLLGLKVDTRSLAIVGTVLGAASVVALGQVPHILPKLVLAGFAAGFTTNGTLVLFYALAAQAYPTALRATGTGFVIGIGRGGAALGPIIAGNLLQSGLAVSSVMSVMALGSLISAAALLGWVFVTRQRK